MTKFLISLFRPRRSNQDSVEDNLTNICSHNHCKLISYMKSNLNIRLKQKPCVAFVFSRAVSSYIGLLHVQTFHDESGKIIHFTKTL